jgi:uncharacterized protein
MSVHDEHRQQAFRFSLPRVKRTLREVHCFALLLSSLLFLACSSQAVKPQPPQAASPSRSTCSSAEQCLSECDAASDDSCVRLGDTFAYGIGGAPRQPARAFTLWQLGCQGGQPRACSLLAATLPDRGASSLALLYASKGCAGGDAAGCTELGVMAFLGERTRSSRERAQGLWRYACAGGDGRACAYLGLWHLADPKLAEAYFSASCERSSHEGCVGLGLGFETGLLGNPDFGRALRAYLQGCDSGNVAACLFGGLLIEENSTQAVHRRHAVGLYEIACDAPQSELCWVDEQRDARWASLYGGERLTRRSCSGNTTRALACFNAALSYERGTLGAVDAERAQQRLEQSCQQGFSAACRSAQVEVLQ